MGDFFEDLGKKITETAEAVSKKTEEVVEVQKLKNQVRGMERSNERDLSDLGKMVYEKFQVKEVIAEDYIEICENLKDREASIIECNEKIALLRGTSICKSCQATLDPEMDYCPKCGSKVERPEPETCTGDVVDEAPVAEETAEDTVASESAVDKNDGE